MLSSCELGKVSKALLPAQLWNTLDILDHFLNQFNCDCHLIWFIQWAKHSNVSLRFSKDQSLDKLNYYCVSPSAYKGINKFGLKRLNWENCLRVKDYIVHGIIITDVVLMLVAFLISVLYRFRWRVR